MSVPNLPGFRSNKPTTTRRPHTFSVVNGIVMEKADPTRVYSAADHEATIAKSAKAHASLDTKAKEDLTATKRMNPSAAPEIPVEVELDRQVLRFPAFFKEAVHESRMEDFRVRKVDILLYLVDATIQVIEHEEHNSGLLQGTMLKRHRITKSASAAGDVEFYGWADLFIGNEVTFYGRTYKIVGCDDFTRKWYAERGYEQGSAEDVPEDAAATVRRAGARKEHYGKVMYPTKKFMEARLGKTIQDPMKLRKFLDSDGKVLRFDGVWDDSASLYGDKNMYIINVFLSDDTVEIREAKVHNSGKEPFPSLLSRQPLPKDYATAKEAGTAEDNPELYYSASDFVIGRTLNILGRDVLIRSCDAFTREYCSSVLGFDQPAAIIEEAEEERKVEHPVPPPTGYGDDEDSLASFYSLVPKVPKKDFNTYMEKDGEIYRFMAQLEAPCPEDAMRRFVIAVYPQDCTVGVYEPPIRNSGIVGGKFLARGKHKKADGTLFSAADFTVGEVTEVVRRRFMITDMDAKTRRILRR